MIEKYGGIWIEIEKKDSIKIVFEEYFPDIDKLQIISKRVDGYYQPYSCIKKLDPQWRLAIWVPENDKTILSTIESAKNYLINFV